MVKYSRVSITMAFLPESKNLKNELNLFRRDIQSSSSQSDLRIVFHKYCPVLRAIFDELAPSISTLHCFNLCFECLSLLIRHEITDPSISKDGSFISVKVKAAEDSSHESHLLEELIEHFLSSMLRVELILRTSLDKTEQTEEEIFYKIGKRRLSSRSDISSSIKSEIVFSVDKKDNKLNRMNIITRTLVRIIRNAFVYFQPMQLFEFQCFYVKYKAILSEITCQIFPFLSNLLTLGISKTFEDSFIEDILWILSYISLTRDNPTKDSLLSLLLPHILPWMKKYPDKKFFLHWINILKNLTLDKVGDIHDITPHKYRSSQLWFVFHPVLDVIKDTASKGVTFDDDSIFHSLMWFSLMSSISSQAFEIYESTKEFLDYWFETMEENINVHGILAWAGLISMFSKVSVIVPHLSPKFDETMELCVTVGEERASYTFKIHSISSYLRYVLNCYPQFKWGYIMETIIQGYIKSERVKDCDPVIFKSYQTYRDDIISFFLNLQSSSEIEKHKIEIKLCIKCLIWSVRYWRCGKNYDIRKDIFSTFIPHLSRVEKVLKGYIDNEFCTVCIQCIYLLSFEESFHESSTIVSMILSNLKGILERGSKKMLGDDIPSKLLQILKLLSKLTSIPSLNLSSLILHTIRPYLKDWLMIYKDSELLGDWMLVLSDITGSFGPNLFPRQSICSEVWCLFHPVLDVVRKEFASSAILKDNHGEALRFFSNLCISQANTLEIFENVRDLLDEWFIISQESLKKWKGCHIDQSFWVLFFWGGLVSMLSHIPSLVPFLSPRYDSNMKWCFEKNCCRPIDIKLYIFNVISYISSKNLISFFYSNPMISVIPSIETSLSLEIDRKLYATSICSGMKIIVSLPEIVGGRKSSSFLHSWCITDICGTNIFGESQDKFSGQRIEGNNLSRFSEFQARSTEPYRIIHSSLIQYLLPQRLLVSMPFKTERQLRASMYCIFEESSAGVELLFDKRIS
ncbi:hypothetical protein ADUPG1_008705 [Aduncisulcus paluster]|uniref:Uncharacterized protein n=1 Tax=Aduncisulcus paluster TaxID=2918883 RepID=A0ABQ5KU90_9EUKA|nr:hypothetical protein ADUPG1_008705 [Aduncisulcus paluster]